MKKTALKLTALLLGLTIASSVFATENRKSTQNADYELEKVLIFSRHGLRSPVEKDPQEMAKYSPYAWAKWDVPSGYLTAKGTVLETYFGQYLGQWLADKGLLTTDRCASGEGILLMRMQYNAQLQRGKRLWRGLLPDVMCNYNIAVKLVQKKIQFLRQKSTTQVKP